jgi:hypothetical protein
MSVSKRLVPVLVVLTIGPAALSAPPAAASRTVAIGSRITIKSTEMRFGGRVTSSNQACAEQRKVVLYKVVSGGPDQALGRARTDAGGRWSVTVSGFAGISLSRFYAKAKARTEGAAGTLYTCRAARSKTIGFSP